MTERLADNELTEFLADFNERQMPPAAEIGAAAMRAAAEARVADRAKGPEMSEVRNLSVPPHDRPARLYRPSASATALVLFLHGGGWVIGDLETHDRACRRLAATSGVSVLALDYRRAPEHPWPVAVDDAVDALRWIASHPPELGPPPAAVAIAGDSAGGHHCCTRLSAGSRRSTSGGPGSAGADLRQHRSRELRRFDGGEESRFRSGGRRHRVVQRPVGPRPEDAP